MSDDDEKIDKSRPFACCNGRPLVASMVHSGSEWYCVDTGQQFGFFGVPEQKEWTPELQAMLEEDKVWHDSIAVHCIAPGMRKNDCAKCQAGEDHQRHATPDEIQKSSEAYKKLALGRANS